MLVVADSSPLIVLAKIGHLEVLPRLFDRILIPEVVSKEVARKSGFPAIQSLIASPPPWLVVQAPRDIETIPMLDAGECAAISLACQVGADVLLIDEKRGRKAAIARGLRITGTIGVLEIAASRGLIDLADVFAKIKQTDFWISHNLMDERLKVFKQRE